METVMIESPYAGDVKRNVEYARWCVRDAMVVHGEAAFASHLVYTVGTDGAMANERGSESDATHWCSRERGLSACEAWRAVAHKTVFYVDLGWSVGMLRARDRVEELKMPYVVRTLALTEGARLFANAS